MPSRVPISLRLALFLDLVLCWSREEDAEGSKAGAMEERCRWLVEAAPGSPERDSLAGVLPISAVKEDVGTSPARWSGLVLRGGA